MAEDGEILGKMVTTSFIEILREIVLIAILTAFFAKHFKLFEFHSKEKSEDFKTAQVEL